ncbi:hypothetical protein Tco_1260164, partial [Tanacetum coccineum]
TIGIHNDEAGSSRFKRSRQHETVEEVLLPQVHHEFLLWEGCNRDANSIMGCDGEIDDMLRIRLREAESNEEILTSMAWMRAFNINEPIYAELCHEFYSTYEFDEVCADDELQSKKIIKFRLGGLAHNLTWSLLVDWDCIMLMSLKKMDLMYIFKEACVEPNFEGDSQDDHLWWMKRKGAGTKKESQICYGQFISKIARKSRVLTDDVIRSLSALINCGDLDTTLFRDLIDSKGKLIPEDPVDPT